MFNLSNFWGAVQRFDTTPFFIHKSILKVAVVKTGDDMV